jgi:hypothetical protein
MYIHCSGCIWFAIVKIDETWMAPLDGTYGTYGDDNPNGF